jgi:nucleoid-associated protein YgaU
VENYPVAKDNAQKAFDLLAAIPDTDTVVTALPKYYVVRLIPEARDCFWRIAEYPFIYGDSSLGGIIYRANKEKLKDPENPDLIFPGQVFLIPSINGEVRIGVFNPDDWDVDLPDPEVQMSTPAGRAPASSDK